MATIVKGKNADKPYTVRFRDSFGRQREKSFRTRKEADTFIADQTKARAYGEDVNLTAARKSFTEAVEHWLATAAIGKDSTRENYAANYRANIRDAYAGMSVKDAASGRETAEELLNVTMLGKVPGTRRRTRHILVSVLDHLVVNGTIASHRLTGIKLAERTVTEDESEDGGFVYITDEQVKELADTCGIYVWLQRTMGLRVGEALGVEKRDFINGGATLRLRWQATRDGKNRVPLKKRSVNQGRDIPVPMIIQKMIADLPDGPLSPGLSTKYRPYNAAERCFSSTVKAMGIALYEETDEETGKTVTKTRFTTHSLRHQFASEQVDRGMNLADLAMILGHKDATVTLQTYVHPSANAQDAARAAMDARWS